MNIETINNALDILNSCLENQSSIRSECLERGYSETYVKNIKARILTIPESIRTEKENLILELHNKASGNFFVKESKKGNVLDETIDSDSKNLEIDEKFDERSRWYVERDSNEQIILYHFEILVRDESPFIGSLSRQQMETLYAYYPYVTRNTVSQLFPFFTFSQFKRILRVFNITKDKLFPQHLLEELDENEIAELALKNKENSAYKKFIENKNKFYENRLRETQTRLFEMEEDKKYLERIIDGTLDKFFDENNSYKNIKTTIPKTYDNKNNVTNGNVSDSLYFFFGDIHFGKCFNETVYGRGVNSSILRERCMEIAYDVVKQVKLNKTSKIYLNVLGDIFESILPDGMHPEHHKRMDLIGDQQVEFAMNVFEEMIDHIQKNISHDIMIYLYGIGGNHDRIQENRDQDKRRTATAIFYILLKKIFSIKGYENLVVYEPEDGILKYADNGISFIGFHGDSALAKSKEIDVMNLFKVGDSRNFTVIVTGHWHSVKLSEGINYKKIICGSVCSVDEFIQNELGKGSQPSYLLLKKSKGYGVDVEIKTLH